MPDNWFRRQLDIASERTKDWPDWARREAGLPSREQMAAAMRHIQANPETDAEKIARLAAGFAGDCEGLLAPEESEQDGRHVAGFETGETT